MSEAIDLLLLHLDGLKVQHDAGINPGPDEIKLLFHLHGMAKDERPAPLTNGRIHELHVDASLDDGPSPGPEVQARPRRDRVTDVEIATRRRRGASRRKDAVSA